MKRRKKISQKAIWRDTGAEEIMDEKQIIIFTNGYLDGVGGIWRLN